MIKRLSDPGLGEKYYQNKSRMVNKDGTFNSSRTGMKLHLYHYLISVNTFKILLLITGSYLACNLVFASAYMLNGVENFGGHSNHTPFLTALLFSMQTFTTVGFGAIYPHDTFTGLLSGMEAMFGLLFFALATGIVYGRFSKPSTSIKFSEKGVIAPHGESGNAFMFRIVNARPNTLIEMSVEIILAIKEEIGDNINRKYYRLKTETSSVVFFPLPWTIVHAINDSSPLSGLSKEDFEKLDLEFVVHIKGFDETYAQMTNIISSYWHKEIEWGAKFKRNYTLNKYGSVEFDINNIGEIEPV